MKIFLAGFLLCGGFLFAQNQPIVVAQEAYHFKKDTLGETIARYKANNADELLLCDVSNSEQPDKKDWLGIFTCTGKEVGTYAGFPVKSKRASFYKDRLYKIVITFDHDFYGELRKAMMDKFGNPSIQAIPKAGNRMGAVFDNEQLAWSNGASSMFLLEYSGNLDTSSVMFQHEKISDEVSEKEKQLGLAISKSDM